MADKDDLFKNIDDAADNLFSQYLVKKPVPAAPAAATSTAPPTDTTPPAPIQPPSTPQPEPIPPSAAVPPPAGPSLDLDLDLNLSEPLDLGQQEDVMEQMEQTLMSIDWEVSAKNLTKGREVLASLMSKHGFAPESPARQVADQMDKVLASMLQSPEGVPVSAPSLLKKALEAIKGAITSGPNLTPEIRKILSQALSELNAVLAPPPVESVALDFNLQMEGGAPETPVAVSARAQESHAPASEPIADFGMELSLESEATPSGIGQPVANDIRLILQTYSATLAAAIKSISPMVNLFANRAGMEKLHDVTEHVREKLSGQERLLSQTFSADYTQYNGIGTVKGWLESQLDILNPCVKRLTKVEALFAKSKGYEKVYELTKKVRKSLAEQQESITTAVGGTPVAHQFDMTGEYPALQPVLSRTPEVSPAAVSAVSDPQALLDSCIVLAKKIAQGDESGPNIGRKLQELLEKTKAALAGSAVASPSATAAAQRAVAAATTSRATKCRWDWLLKTTWAGQLVGMAPEQVAFESQTTFPLKSFSGKTHFPLKKLKSMPWTNLQSLFSGELAEYDKATLNGMELEIAQPPETFRGSSQKKVHVMIMYHGGKGKVFLVETPTEAISITDEGIWTPGKGGSEIAGTLTVYGSMMPVIALD
jgi:hypothetical protein